MEWNLNNHWTIYSRLTPKFMEGTKNAKIVIDETHKVKNVVGLDVNMNCIFISQKFERFGHPSFALFSHC